MKKVIFSFFMTVSTVFAAWEILSPVGSIYTDGNAQDMVVHYPLLYVGTSHGKLQVYDMRTKELTKEITLPKIKDFMGDTIFAAAASIDYLDGRYLLLSDSGHKGYSNLWIHENNITKKILSASDKKTLVKARFIDKDHVLLGFLSDEVSLLDIRSKKERYRIQLSESRFSDFSLNTQRTQAAFSCESGVISVIDARTGRIIKELKGVNRDNVYKVDYRHGVVVAAGQDRRAAYYDVATGRGGFFQASFLIYATGLSPSTRRAAFAMDENNNITIFDLQTHAKIALLKGQKSTLNSIVFVDEKTLVSGSDDDAILLWKLP